MFAEMITISSTMLRRNTRAILKLADNDPVLITRFGKPTYVLMSAAEFERIGGDSEYANTRSEP